MLTLGAVFIIDKTCYVTLAFVFLRIFCDLCMTIEISFIQICLSFQGRSSIIIGLFQLKSTHPLFKPKREFAMS